MLKFSVISITILEQKPSFHSMHRLLNVAWAPQQQYTPHSRCVSNWNSNCCINSKESKILLRPKKPRGRGWKEGIKGWRWSDNCYDYCMGGNIIDNAPNHTWKKAVRAVRHQLTRIGHFETGKPSYLLLDWVACALQFARLSTSGRPCKKVDCRTDPGKGILG